jgi:hypothetical protein
LAISVVASRLTPAQDGPHQFEGALPAPRASACLIVIRSLRDSPKKPHAAPPASILSAWQIKENPVGNDPLIIVNRWISLPPFFADHGATAIVLTTMRPGWGRAGAWPPFAADKRPGWRIAP